MELVISKIARCLAAHGGPCSETNCCVLRKECNEVMAMVRKVAKEADAVAKS